ncbi:MAG: hypothetical protein H6704_09625 [Myxococcales bacterium]|nr:hypothetical protein [Myxococcales bacterium]
MSELSLASLRKTRNQRRRKKKPDGSGIDASLNTAFLLMPVWAVGHGLATADGVLVSGAIGVGGALLVGFGGALFAGMLNGPLQPPWDDLVGYLLAATGGLAWWITRDAYPPLLVATLAACAYGLFAVFFRLERRKKARAAADGAAADAVAALPDDTVRRLEGLPPDLTAAVRAPLDRALADFAALHPFLARDLADDPEVDAAATLRDAVRTVDALARRADRLRRLHAAAADRDSPDVRAAVAEAQRHFEQLAADLHAAADAVLVYAGTQGDDGASRLRERADALRLTADAFAELEAD